MKRITGTSLTGIRLPDGFSTSSSPNDEAEIPAATESRPTPEVSFCTYIAKARRGILRVAFFQGTCVVVNISHLKPGEACVAYAGVQVEVLDQAQSQT